MSVDVCQLSETLTVPKTQVIQQIVGQQVSQPVAQVVAGFAKVFVGEIVENGGSFSHTSPTLPR